MTRTISKNDFVQLATTFIVLKVTFSETKTHGFQPLSNALVGQLAIAGAVDFKEVHPRCLGPQQKSFRRDPPMFTTILQQFTKNGVVSKWIPCRTSLVRLSILTNHENVLLVFLYAFLNHEGLIWCDLFHCGMDIWAVTTFSCVTTSLSTPSS